MYQGSDRYSTPGIYNTLNRRTDQAYQGSARYSTPGIYNTLDISILKKLIILNVKSQ